MWIKNADKWYKLWSVWAMVIITVYPWLVENWALFGEYVPEQYRPVFGSLLGLIGIVVRLLKQTNLSSDDDGV